jgi:hypothetical protein
MKRFVVLLFLLLLVACRPRYVRTERVVHEADDAKAELALTDARLWARPAAPPRLPDQCRRGDVGQCVGTITRIPDGVRRGCPCADCMFMADGSWRWNRAQCNTPLVVSFDESPVEFTRADTTFAIGVSERTEWVTAKTPWVALDRDGSGCIESARELFAGFDALGELDANGDGLVDARDPAFAELVLWSDRDQDKTCTPNELTPLSERLSVLPLAHAEREVKASSYEGDTATLAGGARLVDVHLAPIDAPE